MSLQSYYNKRYRQTEKGRAWRNKQRKSNYAKGRAYNYRSDLPYTTFECKIVLAHKAPDREIAKILNRSVQAIQLLRVRLKKKGLTWDLL